MGLTRDAGWEIGVSRTVDHPLERVWDVLTGSPHVWLGSGARLSDEVGSAWSAEDGTAGELRSRRPRDRLRLTHRRPDQPHETTVQVVVRPSAGGRTSVRFHEERMRDSDERERQRLHWQAVVDRLTRALDQAP